MENILPLRKLNLQLKGNPEMPEKINSPSSDTERREVKFVGAMQLPRNQDEKPIFFQSNRDKPRTHIRAQFFSVSGTHDEPQLLFNALVLRIPSRGEIFRLESSLYEVKSVTRNMELVGQGKIAKEFSPDILVAPYIPRPEPTYRDNRYR